MGRFGCTTAFAGAFGATNAAYFGAPCRTDFDYDTGVGW